MTQEQAALIKKAKDSLDASRLLFEKVRNVGDYDTVSGFDKEEALEQLRHAAKFLELAYELL
jgi:uncharacterized protein (UPF0332 family)